VLSFGAFQSYYTEELLKGRSASDVAWIGTFQGFLLFLVGIVTGPIFDRGYFRQLILLGSFLTVFGIMMTSLSTEYYQVFLAQGVCAGIGAGCLFLPSVSIAATYFSTRRAFATGLTAAGGSVGGGECFLPWKIRR
jgi:MFS family permease